MQIKAELACTAATRYTAPVTGRIECQAHCWQHCQAARPAALITLWYLKQPVGRAQHPRKVPFSRGEALIRPPSRHSHCNTQFAHWVGKGLKRTHKHRYCFLSHMCHTTC